MNRVRGLEDVVKTGKRAKELVVGRKDECADVIGRTIDHGAVLKPSQVRCFFVEHHIDARRTCELCRSDHARDSAAEHRYAPSGHWGVAA
jgi:hypothetical protein